MGICSSCESTATATSTAKLILQDGRLQEFPYPIKASYVIQKDPTSFICNSDDMDFDVGVIPVPPEDHLLPGQIYFSLPLSRLRQPLLPEEMAALAVKASSALANSDKCKCRKRTVVVSSEKVAPIRVVANGGGGRRRASRGGSADYKMNLSAIPE